jgi:hypothetical protein
MSDFSKRKTDYCKRKTAPLRTQHVYLKTREQENVSTLNLYQRF